MLVISSREFREHQKSYLDQIDQGVEVLIRRGSTKSYKIVPVEEDDSLMTKEEFYAMLDQSSREAREGKAYELLPGESLSDLLRRVKYV